MIVYNKFFALIQNKGISTYALIRDGVATPGVIQRMRENESITVKTMDAICKALDCQPGDLMEYMPDVVRDEE